MIPALRVGLPLLLLLLLLLLLRWLWLGLRDGIAHGHGGVRLGGGKRVIDVLYPDGGCGEPDHDFARSGGELTP